MIKQEQPQFSTSRKLDKTTKPNLALTIKPIILPTVIICYLLLLATFVQFQFVRGLSIDKSSPKDQVTEQQTTNVKQQSSQSKLTSTLRRPIWNLAHMVNSIKELDYRLGKGANAVEADVTFSRDGKPSFTYHGPPCDCLRHCHQQENFNDYLNYVREIAIEDDSPDGVGKNLTLLFLDLKLDYLDHWAKENAGRQLAKSVIENLFLDSEQISNDIEKEEKLRLVLSVNHVGDVGLVNNFIHYLDANNSSHLMKRIGFDVGMNDDLQQIESMWKRFGNNNHLINLWQGDGYTNCISPFYNLERLTKALQKRNNVQGYPRKVYQWTIDLHDRMRESLMLGVDAIMTNHPERLLSILTEPDIAHNFRLATRADNPFEKIVQRVNSRNSESARYQRSANPTSGGFFGGLLDVFSSLFAYIKEIPFLSFPTTSRLLPKVKRIRQKTSSTNNTLADDKKQLNSAIGQKSELRVTEHGVSVVKGSENGANNAANLTLANNSTNTNFHENIQRNSEDRSSSTTISEQLPPSKVTMVNNDNEQTATTTTSSNDTLSTTPHLLLESQSENQQPPYEGPKWYTSLVSNVLVSMMKIVLPAQS